MNTENHLGECDLWRQRLDVINVSSFSFDSFSFESLSLLINAESSLLCVCFCFLAKQETNNWDSVLVALMTPKLERVPKLNIWDHFVVIIKIYIY